VFQKRKSRIHFYAPSFNNIFVFFPGIGCSYIVQEAIAKKIAKKRNGKTGQSSEIINAKQNRIVLKTITTSTPST